MPCRRLRSACSGYPTIRSGVARDEVLTSARSKVGWRPTRGKIEFERTRRRRRNRPGKDDAGAGVLGKNHDARGGCHEGNAASHAGENTAMSVAAPVLAAGAVLRRAVLWRADRGVRTLDGRGGRRQEALQQQRDRCDQGDRGTPCNRAPAGYTHALPLAKRAANARVRQCRDAPRPALILSSRDLMSRSSEHLEGRSRAPSSMETRSRWPRSTCPTSRRRLSFPVVIPGMRSPRACADDAPPAAREKCFAPT